MMSDREALEARMGGNDLVALLAAKERAQMALRNPRLTWRERERALEMLSARSLEELETIRAAYAEVTQAVGAPIRKEP